jgi:MinD superfamily P-loop ATPase
MRIVVISGKGGTGKTCVSSALALELGNCVLVDADVDCPNQFLLFRGKVVESREFSASKIAVLSNSVPGFGDYGGVCAFGAISREGGRLSIAESRCEGCGACRLAFPELGIRLEPRQSGILRVVETGGFPLVYGSMVPGEAGSGKVVFELKRVAEGIAASRGIPDIIIDAPAGIGCPVISAISGADHAIGVLEPTPASIANLERALRVAKHFSIPFSIVMNKAGLSKTNESLIMHKYGGLIAAKIPYDEGVPPLLAEGTPPSLGEGPASKALREMAKNALKSLCPEKP